ncbi:transient receptor potential cation channel subfamily M member 7-like isoform X2 [Pseudophryne corroboree]|uniref:transient receptor potential cation channel subfamily M member 7-like isoform X2 n=1 Tax=Pseudophryne corroboree TaxID=495146 RepID=UPI0030818FCB
MVKEWRMRLPKLVISVHGGTQKFDLNPRIKEALSRGFVKAAVTTGAWILTGAVNNGVTEHIGDALKEHASQLCHKICVVGITPWGIIDGRQDLIGRDVVAPYQTLMNPLSKFHVLNSLHTHFILVDDGTVGRHGAEVHIRRELESRICQKQIHARTGKRIPIVALVVEGGPNTILTVFDYLQQSPPVPVVVCEGSGRAADILAYVYKQTGSQGNLPEDTQSDVIATIRKTLSLNQLEAGHMFQTLMACMRAKHLITVYHAGPEEHQDIDVAILTSLLKSTNMSPYDQLALVLAWDRLDIAQNYIFVHGQQWLTKPLEQAMLDALVMDRVAFVKLLIENGVSMQKFLTIPRLEELYNATPDASKETLLHIIQDVKKGKLSAQYKISLQDVGLVIEYLMGGTYRCSYTKRRFRAMYKRISQPSVPTDLGNKTDKSLDRTQKKEKTRHGHFLQAAQPFKTKNGVCEKEATHKSDRAGIIENEDDNRIPFHYVFNELLVWAVLMKRQKMALFFWQHGEESMAKALVATCLYRAMAHEARQWDIFDDTPDKLKAYSKEFAHLAVELLENTYKQNERMTMKLLTYELSSWSKSTCLKLAVSGNVRNFISHACTQKLLTDMWMGRLNLRKNAWFKVILGILLPPIIPLLEYKTKARMSHIPVSQDAHEMIWNEPWQVKYSEEGVTLDAYKEDTFYESGANVPETSFQGKPQHLSLAQKYFAFYHAPIAKFWFNTMAYLAFLMLYTYVVLVKMESLPSVQEWIVVSFIFTTAVDTVREIFTSEAGKNSMKLKVWFSSYLNVNEFLGIITFLAGFGLRFGSRNLTDNVTEDLVFTAGRIIYCLNTTFWFVKLFDILIVHPIAGPFVFMIGKMMARMFFIVVIMGIVVFAFGVPRKSILYPNEEPSWSLAKDVVFRPYWMTYGEMFAYEIDECANDTVVRQLCRTGSWLNGFLQAVYVFVQYIIIVNFLIAIFNNVYMEFKSISNQLCKFQRYHFIMQYYNKPVLPPPLILFNHIAAVISRLCVRRKGTTSSGPKLFLTEEDKKRLHEFEEECIQIYFNDKKDQDGSKSDERIRVTTERVEDIFSDMKDVRDHVGFIKNLLHHLDDHIGHLQDLSGLTLDSMKTLTVQKAMESKKSLSFRSSDLSLSKQTTDDGLGKSTVWKRSRSDHIWGRSFSHTGLEKSFNHMDSNSEQKIHLSDHSALHRSAECLLESQHRALSEELKNLGYNFTKTRSPSNLPEVQNTPQSSTKIQIPSEINVVLYNIEPLQTISPCPESARSPDLGKEGFVNHVFIDDNGSALYENSPEDFRLHALPSPEGSPNGNSECHGVTIENFDDKPLPKSNNNTGVFQKLWAKRKNSGIKLQITKQMSAEEESCHNDEGHLTRTQSCVESLEFQAISPCALTSQISLDTSVSNEDLCQTDSKAALLKEQYYYRRSSGHNKPLQKEAFTRFGCNFKTSMEISFYYSAIERNNLCRLSQNIPFTPLPPVEELVTVYRLEESSPNILNNSMSSWSHNGVYATIEFLSKEEMGGGLRRAVKAICTWSENDILKAGNHYIIKSFLPEVVNTWSAVYKDDTVMQLCLRQGQKSPGPALLTPLTLCT